LRIFVIILCIFLILFFPFWFIQFLAIVVLLVFLLSSIYSRVIYSSIHISRYQDVVHAYKHQIINIDFLLENKSILPVHYISVFESPGKLATVNSGKFIFSLLKKHRKKLTYQVKGMARGEYTLGPIVIKSGDPLGLFPWERSIEKECRIIIYPTIFKIKRTITNGYPGGNITVKDKMYEDVTRVKSIREYIPGDDIRHISWKVSAHLGSLFTREYMQSLHSPALFLLNLTVEDYPIKLRYHHMEKAIEICASLIVFFSSLKQEIGLISSGLINTIQPQIQIQGGHGHAMFLLENLAVIKGCSESADIIGLMNNSHLSFPNGTRIILISPGLSSDQINVFTSIKRKRMFLEYIPVADKKESMIHPRIKTFTVKEIGGEVLYV